MEQSLLPAVTVNQTLSAKPQALLTVRASSEQRYCSVCMKKPSTLVYAALAYKVREPLPIYFRHQTKQYVPRPFRFADILHQT
jgi:hypothetical protein